MDEIYSGQCTINYHTVRRNFLDSVRCVSSVFISDSRTSLVFACGKSNTPQRGCIADPSSDIRCLYHAMRCTYLNRDLYSAPVIRQLKYILSQCALRYALNVEFQSMYSCRYIHIATCEFIYLNIHYRKLLSIYRIFNVLKFHVYCRDYID